MRGDEGPRAHQPLALQPDGETAVRLLLDELVRPPIPDLDGSGPVLAFRDLALELRIFDRVVLDVHGEVLLTRLERDALGDGPARQGAVALEPEVVVEAARVVALDDEDRLAWPLSAPLGERLGRHRRVALAPVVRQLRHDR